MDEKLISQILAVRDSGLTNMFDVRTVKEIAEKMGFRELALYTGTFPSDYAYFIIYGKLTGSMEKHVVVVCYGRVEKWVSRRNAIRHYLEAMASSEGSELERYTNIYRKLLGGSLVCTDDWK
nr:MAG TPA: protein of unknown function (DUF5049) [Caudoviricetes sp.]